MRRNVGTMDARLRGLVAVLVVAYGVSSYAHGLASFVTVLGGLVLMATALTHECPLYRILRIRTVKEPRR